MRRNQTPDLTRFKPAPEADYLWYFGKYQPAALPPGAKVMFRTKHSLLARLDRAAMAAAAAEAAVAPASPRPLLPRAPRAAN